MLKTIFYIFFLIAAYILFCFFLYLPVSYENKVYKDGITSEYLKLPSNINQVMVPQLLTLKKQALSSKLMEFHIGEFQFDLPVYDPTILIRPHIKLLGKQIFYGFSLEDYSGVEILRVEYAGKKLFKLQHNLDKIFSLEISKNILLKKKPIQIYKDVFRKKVLFNQTTYFDILKNPALPIEEAIYNFFILSQRNFYDLDKNSYFIDNKNIYIKNIQLDESTATDYIELYENGIVYTFKISYSSWRESSKKFKSIFLSSIIRNKQKDTTIIENYNTFLSNPYGKRAELKNIIFLFSAWSMNFDDSRYLKAMINTLERSKKFSSPLLKELYDFSIKKFGQTFSIRDEITSQYDSSKAKFKKELEQELIRGNKDDLDVLNFKNENEEIQSGEEYLDKNIELESNDIILE